MIVGRSALRWWHRELDGSVSKKQTDIDIWNTYAKEVTLFSNMRGYDYCQMPLDVMESFSPESKKSQIATLEDLLAIKLSHLAYDIFWHKHKQDALLLGQLTGGRYNEQLYTLLVEHWKGEHGVKPFLSLYKTKDEFFDDFVPKQHFHDFLHELVAFPEVPKYTECLRANEEVMVDQQKFMLMNHKSQIRMFKEEIAVIALERWLIPTLTKENVSSIITISEAWNKSLHKTITALTKNWASEFIVLNLEHFLHPLREQIIYVLAKLNLLEKYMAKQMSFEEFEEFLTDFTEENGGVGEYGFDMQETLLEGNEDVGIELIEQEGGEGEGESAHSVLKVDGVYYLITYNYYSHCGFEFDYAEVRVVTPQQKTITVYE